MISDRPVPSSSFTPLSLHKNGTTNQVSDQNMDKSIRTRVSPRESVRIEELSDFTKATTNWLSIEGRTKNFALSSFTVGSLPFLSVSIMRPETSQNCYSNHLCLLDSASSQNLVDKGFLKSEFPNTLIEPVQSSLQLACSSAVIDMHAKVTLNILFGAAESKIRILMDFYVIPELCNQLTLGLPFFLNRHFDSMTADSVKLNPDITSVLIKGRSAKRIQLPHLFVFQSPI